MKRLTLVAITFFALLSLCGASASGASVGTWLTYREDIAVSTGYGDIDDEFWENASTTVSLNVTLPCTVANLDTSLTNFTVGCTGTNETYNLTVNGNACNSSSWLNATATNVTSLAQMVTAGLDNTATYLHFVFNCTSTATCICMNISGTDVTFRSAWLSSIITIQEKDVTSLPEVGLSSTTSVHTVNNSFSITNSTTWVVISNAVFNITYPSHKISQPSTTFSKTTLAANGTMTDYVQYQKYGPYVYDVDEDVDGRTHEVTVLIRSNEVLTNCVFWELDPDDEEYDEAFDDLDEDSLEIEYNSGDFDDWDWDEDDGILTLEDFTVREGYTLNKFVFTWTEPAPYVPSEETGEGDWTEYFTGDTLISGVPNYIFMIGAILVIALICYIYWPKPKKKRSKK